MSSELSNQKDSFSHLKPEKILDAVESAGFHCTGRCLQLNSMENRVYEVELDMTAAQEEQMESVYEKYKVVKFYRPGRWTEAQILDEHNFTWELTEQEVPVVAPLRNLETQKTLYRLSEEDLWFTIFDKIGGRIQYEISIGQLEQLARMLARLHLVGKQKQAKHRIQLNPETYASQNLNYLIENSILPLDLESKYKSAVAKIIDLSTDLFTHVDIQRIHGDCHFGNVLWGQNGPFWVDFDDMLMGPCIQDIWLLTPNRDAFGLQQREVFLKAYESMIHFDRKSLKLIEPLRALRYIHYSTWIAKRWDDPYFKKSFPHFNSWAYWNEQLSDLEVQIRLIENEKNS